jgi:hypothetical protein
VFVIAMSVNFFQMPSAQRLDFKSQQSYAVSTLLTLGLLLKKRVLKVYYRYCFEILDQIKMR